MATATKPIFKIEYEGKNITTDITAYLLTISYKDALEGESDEVSITLEDKEGLWRGDWFPTKADKLHLWLGYTDLMIDCGIFTVDEIEMSGPPDVVTIKGLAAVINSPIRTKRSKAHEGVTLRQIAQEVADANGFTLVDGSSASRINIDFTNERNELTVCANGIRRSIEINNMDTYRRVAYPIFSQLLTTADSLERKGRTDDARYIRTNCAQGRNIVLNGALPDYQTAKGILTTFASRLDGIVQKLKSWSYTRSSSSPLDNIRIDRVTQNRESDLAFLMRIGSEYGIIFSIRDNKLVFSNMFDLEKGDSISTLDRKQLKSYSIKDTTAGTFKKVAIKHHNPKKNEVESYEMDFGNDSNSLGYDLLPKDDTLELRNRTENQQQAEIKSKVALHKANKYAREGSITLVGNPLLIAGVNFELTGMGRLSGKYQIVSSTHTIDKSGGYSTSSEVRCIDKPVSERNAGSGSGRTDFTAEKKALRDSANAIRTAINRNEIAYYRAMATPIYTTLRDVAASLRNKGREQDATYIESNINIARQSYLSGKLLPTEANKTIGLNFANQLDKIAQRL